MTISAPSPIDDFGPPDEVLVWRFALDQPSAVVEDLVSLLSPEERRRADRFGRAELRDRYAVGRGTLREILGRMLRRDPRQVRLAYGRNGKPFLEGEPGPPALEFNLSHSQGQAVLAVARGRRVGVDLERIRPRDDVERLAARYFSPSECDALLALPGSRRLAAFLRCWTLKEAYLKAIGDGLSAGLDAFEVSLDPNSPPRLLRVEGRPDEPSRWRFVELDAGPEAVGALAVEGHGWGVVHVDHDPSCRA